jgi:outer membrane protein OmpA-like peptidoglycan-associated protein
MTSDEVGNEKHVVEEENYFISMTDMMVGMVFIFIILLMFYVIQFRKETDRLRGANETRAIIIQDIVDRLKNDKKIEGIDPDYENGIIRLQDSILFGSGEWILNQKGSSAISQIGDVLKQVLPCYTDNLDNKPRPKDCRPDRGHRIESFYIEGHTDNIPFPPKGQIKDNLDLSAIRATNTYRALLAGLTPEEVSAGRSTLKILCSKKSPQAPCEPILSVSGYGETRPIGEDLSRNRRIDLRIIMLTPDSGRVGTAVKDVEAKAAERGILK